jgi:hypothetical protein
MKPEAAAKILVRALRRERPEADVGLRPTAFSDPPTVRRSLAAETVVREPVALVALQREFYREAGGEG